MQIKTKDLTIAAMVAALYVALTYVSSLLNLSYGVIQFRLSEALCLLPLLFPSSVWGLFIGCFWGNLFSPFGILDMTVGSLVTLGAALLTKKISNIWLAPLPTILGNGIVIGALLAWETTKFTAAFFPLFLSYFVSVGLSEAVVCYALGIPLHFLLKKR